MNNLQEGLKVVLDYYRISATNINLRDVITSFLLSFHVEDLSALSVVGNKIFIRGKYDNRKDYDQIVDYVKIRLDSNWELLDLRLVKRTFMIRLRSYYSLFRSSIVKEEHLIRRLYFTFRLVPYLNCHLKYLSGCDLGNKTFLFFSGAHTYEALVCCEANRQEALTYSLQHSLYYLNSDKGSQASFAFRNFSQKFLIVWSEYTRDEFIRYGISPDRLLIGGLPRNEANLSYEKGNNILVLLANNEFEHGNHELLKIVMNSGLDLEKVIIKKHPNLDLSEYCNAFPSLNFISSNETILEVCQNSNIGAAIAYNTGAYYDLYLHGMRCLRYNPESEICGPSILRDEFSDVQQLKVLLTAVHLFDRPEVTERLSHILGKGIDEYGSILN